MQDKKIYNQSDLVLDVTKTFDPYKLELDEWSRFLDVLCGNRIYQKEAIKSAIIYFASGEYKEIEDIIKENYDKNTEIQKKYPTINDYFSQLQINNKLFANIDLATGTGKSYVIYGIAQIMLGIGLIERVLVLCPSLTIEKGLMEKFTILASDSIIRNSMPESAVIKNPRIIDANQTIMKGDICVENIHAVYEATGSSIKDSFKNGGQDTLVLNDESHHIFNSLQGLSANSTEGKNIKKWKEFLIDPQYDFRYIMGFTGTAYIEDEYFNDVIYRYSLRRAIDDRIVKSIDYVQKDDSSGIYEKFQKIYQNHKNNALKFNKIKPLSILVTKDIRGAKILKEKLVDFLIEEEKSNRDTIESKVLIVTSADEHKSNLAKLAFVDFLEDKTEWIVSVSMLTEGWDVKNVFQIIPWEDKAFNSKLLIAQVLGRGLRLPKEYESPQPSVIVFNHDSWSKNIKSLVNEVLEIETRIISSVRFKSERNQYHFVLRNLNYDKKEKEIEHIEKSKPLNYSNMWKGGITLISQTETAEKKTDYEDMFSGNVHSQEYIIKYRLKTVDEVIKKILDEFKMRDWEGGIFGLGDGVVYSKENLPSEGKIKSIILNSMQKVGIEGDKLIEANSQRVFKAFSTLFREKGKTVINVIINSSPFEIYTEDIKNESAGLSNFRRDHTLFYTEDFEEEVYGEEQLKIVKDFLADPSFRRGASKEVLSYFFKTPLNFVITNGEPERLFVEELCNKKNAAMIDAWIKSRDVGFFSIDYSYKEKSHTKQNSFNPDFFLKCSVEDTNFYIVVETKSDKDDSKENKAKLKYAREHFKRLNNKLQEQGLNEVYIFHFLSPNAYNTFFQYLRDGRIFRKEHLFKSELEDLLEKPE